MIGKLSSIALAAVLVALPARAALAETVQEILEAVDANLTKVQDQTYTAELEVIRDGKTIKTLSFIAKLKGLQMKNIRFTAPGDVKGTAVLTTASGVMYVYLPAYKRVRLVAAHTRKQGFMGTDLSAEEMGTAALSVGWDATIVDENDSEWVLDLLPQEGTETSFHKIRVTVCKEYKAVTKIEYMDSTGKVLKSQVRTEWKTFGPILLPTLFTVKDHRTGSTTLMRFFDCEVNQGLPDSLFTKRAIMRGN